jgi:hypothetical protein
MERQDFYAGYGDAARAQGIRPERADGMSVSDSETKKVCNSVQNDM